MPQHTAPRHWTVTLAPGTDLPAATQALRQAGLQVEDVLDMIGVVTGQATAAQAARLRQVPGVADVSATPGADVGPPDADPS